MLKNFFKKKEKEDTNNKNVLIIALLIHAAKIDENYIKSPFQALYLFVKPHLLTHQLLKIVQIMPELDPATN